MLAKIIQIQIQDAFSPESANIIQRVDRQPGWRGYCAVKYTAEGASRAVGGSRAEKKNQRGGSHVLNNPEGSLVERWQGNPALICT